MIRIVYNDITQQVELTAIDEPSAAWIEIRRLCEEKSNEIINTSSYSLTIPWWRFISFKGDIQHIFIKYNIKLDIGEQARKLLLQSKQKQNVYYEACQSPTISNQNIKDRLNQVGFKRTLKDYQIRNVAKLAALPAGASFSVPGAGKTTEALAYYYLTKTQDSKLLIVAPKNAFSAWEEQIQQCVNNPPLIVRLRGGYENIKQLLSENPSIIMITYHQLPKVSDLIGSFMSRANFHMFVDESHRMKRGTSGTIGNAILSLCHIPEKKLILSGTPMPQSAEDLVPQFNFLYPEINVDKETIVNSIKPIYVRTTKSELDLKKQIFRLIPIEMSTSQRRLYDLLRSESAREAEILLKAKDRNVLRYMGRSVLRLIQLTSNPSLLVKSDFQYHKLLRDVLLEGDSPKIKYACSRARELASKGKKTIIWSSFVENVELLSLRLADLGADYIHGGVDSGSEEESDTREAKIKRFHDDPNAYVLVANPAAASEGISLHTVCHNAIYLDRNYNAAQFLQSVDRIHRLGLSRDIDTIIEIIHSPESIDESVNRRLETKINFMAEVLNDSDIKLEYEYSDEEIAPDGITEGDIIDAISHVIGKVSE